MGWLLPLTRCLYLGLWRSQRRRASHASCRMPVLVRLTARPMSAARLLGWSSRHLEGNQYVQELFHGPTASFKDLALQLMPQLFSHCLPPDCNFLVLVATSGDTGSAVLSGFGGLGGGGGEARGRTGVLVFYPQDGVSGVQKLQMASYCEGNARAVSVRADFDFCQRSIKRMFGEGGLAGHLAVEYGTVLSTANSINWARLLPQVRRQAGAGAQRPPGVGDESRPS